MSEKPPVGPEIFHGKVSLWGGDARHCIAHVSSDIIDAVVTDPPYALVSITKRFGKNGAAPAKYGTDGLYARASAGFMGKAWDNGETAFDPEFWKQVLRVLKPGGHVVAFGGTRSYHRLACAIEDAGFEIRDCLQWIYGSGFPKSHDVSKGIDRAAGAEREIVGFDASKFRVNRDKYLLAEQSGGGGKLGANNGATITAPATSAAREWQGWGTALKPACEPIVLARKPLSEKTVAANVLRWGTGAINVDGCRIDAERETGWGGRAAGGGSWNEDTCGLSKGGDARPVNGRWPANLIHDGSDEVIGAFPEAGGGHWSPTRSHGDVFNTEGQTTKYNGGKDGFGSAARFFYTAKADADDRLGFTHPTIKPVDLMQWLVRLVTPKGGVVLDPFAGTGTTGEAAFREGMRAILIEREPEYQGFIRERMRLCLAGPDERSRETHKRKKEPPREGLLALMEGSA